MPEHIHLLMSEPEVGTPSTVMQAVKLGFAKRVLLAQGKSPTSRAQNAREMGHPASVCHHIWQRRFYDFNVWSQNKQGEKLHYMHNNPVERGLVQRPEDWKWSSFLSYATGEHGPVRVNDWSRREQCLRVTTA
jgi:putative transposase